jgi:hypothetical protein
MYSRWPASGCDSFHTEPSDPVSFGLWPCVCWRSAGSISRFDQDKYFLSLVAFINVATCQKS